MVKELLIAKSSSVFWKRSQADFPGIFVQRVPTSTDVSWLWRIMGVVDGGSVFLVPEGRKGECWKSFVSELQSVMNHFQSSYDGEQGTSKPAKSTAEVLSCTAKDPEPPQRRSFAEVMMHSTKFIEPLTLKTRPTTKLLKEADLLTVKKPRVLAKPDALKVGAKKPAMKLMGHAGSDFASVGEGNFHFFDSLERYSFRNMLARLKWDVERSLKWLDSGLSPCACGLLGPTPKPPNAAHCDRKPIVAGPVGALSYKAKRKAKKGFVGSQPKVFKPIVGKQGLGQPKSPGPGPEVVSARNDKGKAKLVYEGPRPKLFSKPILGKQVTVQL